MAGTRAGEGRLPGVLVQGRGGCLGLSSKDHICRIPGQGGGGGERERDKERERESNPGVGERGWRERGIRPGMGTELGPRTEPCSAAVASNVQSPGLVEIETVWI